MRIQFLIHKRLHSSFGLTNSCNFTARLLHLQYPCEVAEIDDGNGIDRAVTSFKPDLAIIEALWVTPAKLREVARLHKRVQWIVRLHSHLPFLTQEGIAIEWLEAYRLIPNVFIAVNDERLTREFSTALGWQTDLLPTGYWPGYGITHTPRPDNPGQPVNIGCFGAIRPFKNQLTQAFAAIAFCRAINRPLRFHVNGPDIGPAYDSGPQMGAGILKNLCALFAVTKNAELILHGWYAHRQFLQVINAMDVGMQVSFTETFNIVAADFAWNQIPIVASHEIPWLDHGYLVDNPSSTSQIVDALNHAYANRFQMEHCQSLRNLKYYNAIAYTHWLDALEAHDFKAA